jgi:antitoxin (DNA-binding transcriptional repressor) of toxin-antitoxin stability system
LVKYLVYYKVMIRINVSEAKARLSHLLEQVELGETVVICRRNVAIAELRPVPQTLRSPRPVGIDRGRLKVPESFFVPLPEDLLDAFEGGAAVAELPGMVAEGDE